MMRHEPGISRDRAVRPSGLRVGRAPRMSRRRGLILVVVLVMVSLLSLLAAGYVFMAGADMGTVMANQYRFQARMAAESGVQRAIVMLRGDPDEINPVADLDMWFDNPKAFRGAIVYAPGGSEGKETFRERAEETADEDATYDPTAEPVWRFNLVAPNYDEPEEQVRYGITDECSRLDLNVATEEQLHTLLGLVIPQDSDHDIIIDELVDALLDWRERGGVARPNGAKDEHYQALDPPYRCKSAPFSTVEELLLVRGFTGWVVFGEDFNRNGLLDLCEDDGDETFPPDDADGRLYPGLARFLTVWSREMNTSNHNAPRVNLNLADLDKLQEKLEEFLDGEIISYVMDVRAGGKTFNSVMNLIPAPPPPEDDAALLSEEGEEAAARETTTPEEGEGSSEAEDENAEGAGEESSDLDQTGDRSENSPAPSRTVYQNLTEEDPPGSYADLPLLLDRLSAETVPLFLGRINVSTAPREVLATIEGLTEAEVDAMITARKELTGEERATPAWLLINDVLDEYKFRQILSKITTKSSVFRIESVGYADHVGVVERLNVVVEMRGPIAQVLYYRNLGDLGPAYTPHGDERRERVNR